MLSSKRGLFIVGLSPGIVVSAWVFLSAAISDDHSVQTLSTEREASVEKSDTQPDVRTHVDTVVDQQPSGVKMPEISVERVASAVPDHVSHAVAEIVPPPFYVPEYTFTIDTVKKKKVTSIDYLTDPATAPHPRIGNDAESSSIASFRNFDPVAYLDNYSRGNLLQGAYIADDTGVSALTAQDAHQQRVLEEFRALQVWAQGNRIFLSEMGIANNDDDAAYRALMHTVFAAANVMDVSVTAWAMGEWWGGYHLVIADPRVGSSDISAPFTSHLGTSTYFRGVNLAGGEFGLGSDAQGNIGTHGTQYTYHINSSFWQGIKNMGFTHVRFPFRLERLFTANGSFNTANKALMEQAFINARAAGLKIVLDPHNYASIQIQGKKEVLGGSVFTANLYATMLTNLAALSTTYADVIDVVALMNEPKAVAPSQWEALSQQGLTALRTGGWHGAVEVPTGNWQGIQDVPTIHAAPWITDPLDNFYYGVHQYYDVDHSGFYQSTYAADESLLRNYYTPGIVYFE